MEKNEINVRVCQWIEYQVNIGAYKSEAEYLREHGFAVGKISVARSGKAGFKATDIRNILISDSDLNADWVMTGRGNMVTTNTKFEINNDLEGYTEATTTEKSSTLSKRCIDRLEEFMFFKGINCNQMTVVANLSNGLIGKAFNSRSSLNSDSIEKILIAYPELNADWLMVGRGKMLMEESHESTNNESLTIHLKEEMNDLKLKNEALNREIGRLEGQLIELKKHNALLDESVECADARKLVSGE